MKALIVLVRLLLAAISAIAGYSGRTGAVVDLRSGAARRLRRAAARHVRPAEA